MTHIPPTRLVEIAKSHLEEPAPKNTCWSSGGNKWPQEAGLPGIGTNSTAEARERAKAGYHGWSYHEGMAGVRVGDFLDWDNDGHTSIVESIDEHGNIRSIGAGGPTGKVYWQPQSKGYNPPKTFKGYFRPPTDTGGKGPAKPVTKTTRTTKPKTAQVPVVKAKTYTVRDGDDLTAIARTHHTSINAIIRRNRALITNRDHIETGWELTMP